MAAAKERPKASGRLLAKTPSARASVDPWRVALARAVEELRGTSVAPGLGFLLEQFLRGHLGARVALGDGSTMASWARLATFARSEGERAAVVAELLASASRLLRAADEVARGGRMPDAKARRALRIPDAYGSVDEQRILTERFVLFAEKCGRVVRQEAGARADESGFIEFASVHLSGELPDLPRVRAAVTPAIVREVGALWNKKQGRTHASRERIDKWERLANLAREVGMPAVAATTMRDAWKRVSKARRALRK